MENFEELILRSIREYAAGYPSLKAAAESLGVTYETFRSWHDGMKSPSIKNLSPIAEKIGISLTGKSPIIKQIEPGVSEEAVKSGNLCTINVYAVAGAGSGILPDQLKPLFSVLAPSEYFRRSDYAVMISGHSMESLIPHGSIIGIKTDEPFQANELFLADIPYEGMVVKRIGVDRATEEFIFKSQNPDKDAYPDFRLSIPEAKKIIIGRVVWVLIRY